jgi:hypothetical protein
VEDVLRTECRDPNRIEHLLDGILDFCCDPVILRLFKKLCRYYFPIDPEAIASYVNTYREMWDEGLDGELMGLHNSVSKVRPVPPERSAICFMK